MSSDSEHTPKPLKRRRVVISDSESSDGSVITTRRRRRVYQVASEDDSSDEDSDVPKPRSRRKNDRIISGDDTSYESSDIETDASNHLALFNGSGELYSVRYTIDVTESGDGLVNSDSDSSAWQSDWQSGDENSESTGNKSCSPKPNMPDTSKSKVDDNIKAEVIASNSDSDSSDGQSEKCPICLLSFKQQQLATPESCDHTFCLDCLLEWSKNINTCPVDRQQFTQILVRNKLHGKVLRQLPVSVKLAVEEQIQEDPTFCEVCQQCDREDRMLLCDGCDLGYHLECLTPPMDEVPMDEWFCPDCSQNSQNDAEMVEIDLEEVPDLMEEARRLGVSYGRSGSGRAVRESSVGPRIIPRTRQTERVRANIRADRDRNRAVRLSRQSEARERASRFDPDQPSTSSGIDSIYEYSRSRSSQERHQILVNGGGSLRPKTSRATVTKRKSTKRKTKKRKTQSRNGTVVREVRITEINDDGEEEEIVTYVKVKPCSTRRRKTKKSKNTRKRRTKKRRARTALSLSNRIQTVKKRLALTLGMNKPIRDVPLLIPTVKTRSAVSDRAVLNNSRYQSGISRVSLFGNDHDWNYSPTGPDEEFDYSDGNGLIVNARGRNATSSIRRYSSLKSVANPIPAEEPLNAADFIGSILNSQEFWHSKKSDATLKADGTLLVNNNTNNNNNNNNTVNATKQNKHSENNNDSPIKKKILTNECENATEKEKRLDLSSVQPNDVTQAPMYNSPRGGGNRGNFRGNYCDNGGRHSYGGQGYGGRESYGGGGRNSYGGSGPHDGFPGREFGPPMNFNPNFEMRGPPPFRAPPFRNRNPQNFRNERPRFPMPDRMERPTFMHPDINERPAFPHPNSFPRFRPPSQIPSLLSPLPMIRHPPVEINEPRNLQEEASVNFLTGANEPFSSLSGNETVSGQPEQPDEEEFDLYSDMEAPRKPETDLCPEDYAGASTALLPPPEPPSGLLDFEENSKSSKDNDSDQELVIDDTPKEEAKEDRDNEEEIKHVNDKYDPFTVDSDSNDSRRDKNSAPTQNTNIVDADIPIPLEPPPFPHFQAHVKPGVRLTAYDDDEDDDSQADCPNFSIYSSQTMDVARHTEQELSQQIGPLEPPPMPPDMPDDDDIIVRDVQACDLADIPEPSDPYVESLQRERRTLSKIPSKKISNDSRGKITFKIGNKLRLSNKLSNLYDELDENIETSIQQEKEVEDKKVKQSDKSTMKIASKDGDNVSIAKDESIAEKSLQENQTPEAKLVVQENVSVDAAKDHHTIIIDNEDKSDDDEEEKLKELEKELKEKEQKLREMEQQEEIDNRTDKDVDSDIEEMAVEEKVTHKVSKHTEDSSLSNKKEEDTSVDELPKILGRSNREDARKPIIGGWIKVPEVKVSEKEAVIETREDKATALVVASDGDDSEEDATSENQDIDEEMDKSGSGSKIDEETVETFPLEKDASDIPPTSTTELPQSNWESDGAYTPCKDELPVKGKEHSGDSPFESGLEPITPTKDKANDDLDGCRTPAGYAGLGTEAISETDEPMNFEDEVSVGARKEKEMEDGEIVEDGKTIKKVLDKTLKEKEEENKKKKRKKEKEKGKEADKNKENISSQNQVSWKKISKNTRERQYREKDKKSKSKEREKDRDKIRTKKKGKEVLKKKEKRKELERYNVRKIVAEKPRQRKDEYGRDIREETRSRTRSRSLSRRRSLTRERRSRSYSRVRSRSRTRSRGRRSWSRNRRSYTKTRSLSRRRSVSRSRRRLSRRRSLSRKRSTPRRLSVARKKSKSVSRKRRSLSPRRRSRGRSLSKSRRSRSRSRERKKVVERLKKYKSTSRSRNRKRSRSKTPKRVVSRSREKKHVKRKHVSRSRSRDRSQSRKRERNKNWEPVVEKAVEREKYQSRDCINRRSWSAQWTPSWSRSRTPSRSPARHEEVATRGWSPPPILDNVTVPPKNLTVILTNKEAIKKKKKEKRKEAKRGKDLERRKRAKRNRTPPPSKEVFASGDNILVSVCFNKENEANTSQIPELPETIPLLPPTKRRRRESAQLETLAKRSKKEKPKEKRPKSPKVRKEKRKKSRAAEIAATKKPVAVIDLDQSPFREQTPSPRDIIVLSDDEDKQVQGITTPEQGAAPRASSQHEQFVSQGPKTPPEPQIKFSINKQQNNLRTSMINPLHEEEEEEEEIDERADEELEMRAQEELELRLKIGPNTPPEPPTSPPTSPDAYDPFDPTKSRSPTPAASQELTPADERDRNQCSSPRNHVVADTPSTPNEMEQKQQEQQSQDKAGEKPKIISMVTLKRASPKRDSPPVNENQTETTQPTESPSKSQQNQQNSQSTTNSFTNMNPVLATVAAAVQRSTMFNSSTPIGGQRTLLQANRISPINQTKQRSTDRPQLPNLFANPVKLTPLRGIKSAQNKNNSIMGQNGSDATLETTNDILDMSSPYSPGSSLSDGIFDPPSPGKSPQSGGTIPNKNNSGSRQGKITDNKKDAFDALFGLSPAVKNLPKSRGRKVSEKDKRKKSTNPKVGVRMDENQLQILDDLPSSAVEMQVKDKFLKKLNRQERVVEEVKLVLKPHYTKKHVTKEEYKDIMRKAVPKICHNKTGEINPKKIAQLVEAYVKKCRNNKKKFFGGVSNSAKGSKAMKNLWS